MNPLNPFPTLPNSPGEPLPCAQVWRHLTPHQRDALQRILLGVCCQLASLSQRPELREAQTPPAASQKEVAHERAERAAGASKIASAHLERWACIYVRQSSLQQVEHHRESQANQYRLTERARSLGWSETRIRVIDTDLGKSGQSSALRAGFNELLADVALGQVGIIFGYEVSRLARNNGDWYRLLDLAAVFGTLIADSDGVYDPRLYNDRLLLGLKGTLSEAVLENQLIKG